MCILIHHPKDSCFTQEQLADFFSKNSDGFGAIVNLGNEVKVIKSIGNLQEIEDLYYKEIACSEAVIHFRMRTHGDYDLDNCHPYEVLPGLYMAHNGVLSMGNAADPKMSDTWHYIQNYLKPLLEVNPDLLRVAAFREMIGAHIGSNNKFAFMNQDGESFIINRNSGVDHEGIWYSNTYAWSPHKFGFYQPNKYYTGLDVSIHKKPAYDHSKFATSSTWKQWDAIDRQQQLEFSGPAKGKKKGKKKEARAIPKLNTKALGRIIRSSYNSMMLDDYEGVVRWVEDHPMKAMNLIYELCGSETNKMYNAQTISDKVNNDPSWAAETIIDLWDDMGEIMLDIAGIDDPTMKGNAYVPA
jgi:hypothetical protein